MTPLILGLKDLFTLKGMGIALFPFFLMLFAFAGELYLAGEWLIPWIIALVDTGSAWAQGGIETVTYIAVFGIGLLLNLFIALALIGQFFTGTLIAMINKRHYQKQIQGFDTVAGGLANTVKGFKKAAFWLLPALLLTWVPLLGPLLWLVPGYRLFAVTVPFDIGSQIMSRSRYDTLVASQRLSLTGWTTLLYLLTLVPIAGLFVPVLAYLVLGHYFLRHLD